mgnify:CR=1 FL=1
MYPILIVHKDPPNLSPRQARFVLEYLLDLNATQAAIRCGYSPKTAASQASRLLTNVKIRAAVAANQAKRLASNDLSADRILEEIRRIAFSDVRVLFDAKHNLRHIKDLSDAESAAIASVEVLIKNAKAGDGVTDTIYKVRQWDKLKALEMAAKRFGLLAEHIEHTGGLTISWQAPE